jgi:2',3'-cyclic-nucleotide 2'-phosphodiesterase (5'-nucleotidase family)
MPLNRIVDLKTTFSYAVCLIAILSMSGCARVWHIADLSYKKYPVEASDSLNASDTIALGSTISPFRKRMETEMLREIGYVEVVMPKTGVESLLSNWFGDMIYRQATRITGTPPDFAFMNSGGIRLSEMPAGTLHVGKIYELMPFDNFLVIVDMSGMDVERLFQKIAAKKGGWPVSSHISCDLFPNLMISINGEPLDANRVYKVATSNFLADGGDLLDFMVGLPRKDYPIWIRDMMVDDVEQQTTEGLPVRSVLDGRLRWND